MQDRLPAISRLYAGPFPFSRSSFTLGMLDVAKQEKVVLVDGESTLRG
jgi:hypothetical protein